MATSCDRRPRGAARSILIPWLFLTACQAQPTTALDTLIQIREACAAGDPTACRQLADASGASEMHTVHLAPDTRAEQVQKDVAAIIRGMQRSSASNGL